MSILQFQARTAKRQAPTQESPPEVETWPEMGPISAKAKSKPSWAKFHFEWTELVAQFTPAGQEPGFDDEIEYSPAGRRRFTDLLILEFGFARLPTTIGELHAVFDYCDILFGLAGGYYPSADLELNARAIALNLEACQRDTPERFSSLEAYVSRNLFALRRHHSEAMMCEITKLWVSSAG